MVWSTGNRGNWKIAPSNELYYRWICSALRKRLTRLSFGLKTKRYTARRSCNSIHILLVSLRLLIIIIIIIICQQSHQTTSYDCRLLLLSSRIPHPANNSSFYLQPSVAFRSAQIAVYVCFYFISLPQKNCVSAESCGWVQLLFIKKKYDSHTSNGSICQSRDVLGSNVLFWWWQHKFNSQ